MIDEAGEFVKMEDLSKSQSSLSKKAKIELQQYLATVFENSSQVITDKSVFIAGATMVDYLRNEFKNRTITVFIQGWNAADPPFVSRAYRKV